MLQLILTIDRVPEAARDCVAALGAQLADTEGANPRIRSTHRGLATGQGPSCTSATAVGPAPFFGAQEWVA